MPSAQPTTSDRIVRLVSLALLGLVFLLLLAVGAGALYLSQADLKPLVEREASEALGRTVSFGSFQVRWGDPLRVDFTDLAIANAPWGSKPEMVRIGQFSAQLEVGPLLHGVLHYRQLRLADVTVVLERDPDGIGNWKFGGSAGSGGFGLVPKTRTQFPTLIDFAGERGLVTYRTRSGNILGIRLDRVAISSQGDETPVQLLAEGAYNDVPARLDATTESYAVLRDAAVPFGTRFTLAGPDTDIAFNGTLQEPLDFEGARGELSIEARTLDDLIAAMGGKAKADLPLTIAGILVRNGDHWSLDAAKGQLQQSDFSGALALTEGKPKQPDDIALDLGFSDLDIDALAAAFGKAKGTTSLDALPLRPEGLGAVNATVDLTADTLAIAGRKLRTVALDGRLAGGDVTLKELSFALGGGRLSASGTLKGEDKDGRLALARTPRQGGDRHARARAGRDRRRDPRPPRSRRQPVHERTHRRRGAEAQRRRGGAADARRPGGAEPDRAAVRRPARPVPRAAGHRAGHLPARHRDPQRRHRRDLAAAPGIASGGRGRRRQDRPRAQAARSHGPDRARQHQLLCARYPGPDQRPARQSQRRAAARPRRGLAAPAHRQPKHCRRTCKRWPTGSACRE